MTCRPGRNLILMAAAIAASSIVTFTWPMVTWLLVGGFAILGIAAEFERRRVKQLLQRVSVSRNLPTIVGRGKQFPSQLRVSNGSATEIKATVRDVISATCTPKLTVQEVTIAANSQQTVTDNLRIATRGRNDFGPVWIRVTGPWNLLEGQSSFDCRGSIRVLPETFASSDELAKDTQAVVELLDKVSRAKNYGVGTEFESLYAFRQGDDPRRIDWRTTARMRQPIVKRFQVERHRDIMVLLDCGRLMGSETGRGSKLDCAVDAALNLCRVALQSGDRCGIAAYDSDVRGFLPPIAGIKSLNSIVECVYDLQTRWKESDFSRIHAELQMRQSKRSLLVVLSDLADVETSRLQCAALRKLSRRHLVLFVALKTPRLKEILQQPTDTLIDGASKAVTYRLLKERSQTLHVLERAGVHVLDVEPQQVTVPLINQFVELRQRNLL